MNNKHLITTREQAQAHLRNMLQPALAQAEVGQESDVAALGEPEVGNVAFVDGHPYWSFAFPGGVIHETHPHQWLAQDGRLIFTEDAPPDNDLDWPAAFDAEIRAGVQALDESGGVLALSPAPSTERET